MLLAEPAKALVDYLYFVDLKQVSLNDRLELRGIAKKKVLEYAAVFKRPSLMLLVKHIYVEQRKPRIIY